MKPKDSIFISFKVNNAYKLGIPSQTINLELIQLQDPLADNGSLPAWVTKQEADYYNQIISNGSDFWSNEYDDLDFTYVSQSLFDRWRLSL